MEDESVLAVVTLLASFKVAQSPTLRIGAVDVVRCGRVTYNINIIVYSQVRYTVNGSV